MNTTKPYINLVNFDRLRELHWCHGAISRSIVFFRHITGEEATMEDLLNKRITEDGIKSLLFGAMCEASNIEISEYLSLYNDDECFSKYVLPVLDGVAGYWFDSDGVENYRVDQIDLLYPEIKNESEVDEFYFLPIQIELMNAGFSLDDIDKLTMKGTLLILNAIRGVKVQNVSWLEEV